MDLVVLIDRADFKVSTKSRLIKAADVVSITSAQDLLLRAQEHVRNMQEQLAQRFEQERDRGYAEGLQAAQQEWSERLGVAQATRHLALKNLAPVLVDIVVDAVSVILKEADSKQVFSSALSAVDDLIRRAKWASFRVHPDKVEAAQLALNRFAQGAASSCDWIYVVPDPSLPIDACIFETDAGTADASLSTQLQFVRSAMESAVASLIPNEVESTLEAPAEWPQTAPPLSQVTEAMMDVSVLDQHLDQQSVGP